MQSRQDLVTSMSSIEGTNLPTLREQYWCFSRRTYLENILIVALIAFCIFTLSFVVSTSVVGVKLDDYKVQVSEMEEEIIALKSGCYPTCLTPDQIESASNIVKSMNNSIDPCTDFYEFVCGGWDQQNPVPPESSTWQRMRAELSFSHHEQLEQILTSTEEPADPDDPLLKAKLFYRNCIRSDGGSSDLEGVNLLKELTEEFQQLDTWSSLNVALAHNLSMQRLLPIRVFPDEQNSTLNIIHITLPYVPMMLHGKNITTESQQHYSEYLNDSINIVERLKLYNFDKYNVSFVDLVLELEKMIINLTHEVEGTHYNRMTIEQLQNITPVEELKWLDMISTVLETEDLSNMTELVLHSVQYIQEFDKINDLYSNIFFDYLFLQVFLELGPSVHAGLRKTKKYFLNDLSGALQPFSWAHDCVEETNNYFGFALSQEYLLRHFNESYVLLMESLVNNLRDSVSEHFTFLPWLDEESLPSTQDKLKQMSFPPAYQQWLLQPETVQQFYEELNLSDEYFTNLVDIRKWKQRYEADSLTSVNDRLQSPGSPTNLESYNIKYFNSIVVPASMIRRPLLGLGNTALNYGAMGAFIARKIARAFDSTGRKYDSLGHLQNESLWNDNTLSDYNDRTDCLVDQYNSYQVTPELKLNGLQTLDSNVADAAGLKFAWLAFSKELMQIGLNDKFILRDLPPETPELERNLPGLEQFSAEQLFFIAYTHTLCSTYTEKSLHNLVLFGHQSPNRFRVLGTLANSEEFVKAFSCTRNDVFFTPQCPLW